jgi:hypothetical protein
VFGDPQSLNLYVYVRNDPVTRADLDGHQNTNGAAADCGDAPCSGKGSTDNGPSAPAQNQKPQTVVFSDSANATPSQNKPGAAADRTVDYQAGKMDKNGHIDSHDIDRNASLTLHEKLDPNSKTKAGNIEDKPHTETGGVYKDYQFVTAGGSFTVLRDWKVNGNSVNVLDTTTHKAFQFEVVTFDTYAKPPIKTEYTNTPPF